MFPQNKNILIMKKFNLTVFCLVIAFTFTNVTAQVGIGTTTPRGAFEINSTTNGFITPQVALTSTSTSAPVVNPQTAGAPITGTEIFNTATAGSGATAVTPGYYYWDGSSWVRLLTDNTSGWSLLGNTGTTESTNYIGTTDDAPIVLKTNGSERMRVTETGELAIGNTDPVCTLDVTGTILANDKGNNGFVLNSTGINYGFLSNPSENVWSLGYGPVITTLATPVLSWTADGNIGLGTASPSALLHLKDGHIKSEQTTAPTLAITTANGISGATISSTSSDIRGLIDISGAPTSSTTTSLTITFNNPYNSAPIVMVSLANDAAQDYKVWVDSVTTTTFNINFKSSSTVNPRFAYFVIE